MDYHGTDVVGDFFNVDAGEGVGEEGFGAQAGGDAGAFGEGFAGD